MKAAFLTGIKQIEIRETKKPTPKKGEVLVRLISIGICGSDVHYYRTGKIGSQVVDYPFIAGHECSGVVEEITDEVTGLSVGNRVAIEPAISCGKCEFCISGRPNVCPKVRFLGTPATENVPAIEGAFREYITIPSSNAIPIPDNMDFEEATLTEVLAIAVHAIDLVKLNPRENVAIFGSGPIGLGVLLMAKLSGAATIFATDLIKSRLEMAKKLGADYTVNPNKKNPVEIIKSITGGRGVDVTFEAAGEQETINHSLEAVRIGGRVAIIGIPELNEVSYDPDIRRKEPVIYHVRRSNQANRDVERAISLMENGLLKAKPLVTHKFPLDRIKEALDMVDRYEDGVVKAMIAMDLQNTY
jgi:L-iditol 2-dehydrogenase